MELWIRSQDRESLRKINTGLYLKQGLSNYAEGDVIFIVSGGDELGEYKTKERALEVLGEIQSKLKATFLMKPKDERFSKYVEDGKKYLEDLNGICVVTGDRCFDLEPINKDIDVYEMPKE